MITFKNVNKYYKDFHALKNINLSVDEGEILCIIGPSGSGKSTLMNTLGCLDRPTAGSYLLAGEEVVTMTADGRARLRNDRIGFVFQNFNLLNRTSALENVELPLLYSKRVTARQRQQRAAELLDLVGLADRMDHHPGQLSGGQQQRVAIARALINDPSIIMADEPTGNLDTRTSEEIINLFRKLNSESITIILVTHDNDVAQNASRTITLRDGLVVSDVNQVTESASSP